VNAVARKVLGYAAASAVLVLGWALLAWLVDSPALPGPVTAITAFVDELPALWPETLASAWRVFAALAIGTGLAVPLGLAMGRSPRLDAVFAPLLLVLLGLGDAPKIALIALIIFFQVLVAARDAAHAIPEASVLSVRSLGADRMQLFGHVVWPAALPDIFTALRVGTGTAIAVLFLAESIAGSTGLGWYIVDAWGRIDYPAMFAGILALALLGVVLYEALDAVETRATRWRRAGR